VLRKLIDIDIDHDARSGALPSAERALRVVIVAPRAARARWRARAVAAGLTIVAGVDTLAEARAVAGADMGLVPAATRANDSNDANDPDELTEALTPREMQVLELVAEGLPNKAIAVRLDISDQTVKFHVASICGKLGAANRTEAVRRAVRRGLLTL